MSKKFTQNKNFEVTFENTFESPEDLNDWNTTYYYGSRTNTFNNEKQYYPDDEFQFNDDGMLSIVATKLETPIEAFEGGDQWPLDQQGKDNRGRGRDVILGIEFGDMLMGRREVDILIGGHGADVFKLGDETQVGVIEGLLSRRAIRKIETLKQRKFVAGV
ncbi:MAG: hypothetical protein QNJ46_23705 [Leptolyngbyaceae cyanobacterium MO_188.B28]|nr:hypothetical protein [Leptolyngbyaceae cyanobacterium MO_188.B28]